MNDLEIGIFGKYPRQFNLEVEFRYHGLTLSLSEIAIRSGNNVRLAGMGLRLSISLKTARPPRAETFCLGLFYYHPTLRRQKQTIRRLHFDTTLRQRMSELSTLSHSHLYNHEQQFLIFVEHPYNFNFANKIIKKRA